MKTILLASVVALSSMSVSADNNSCEFSLDYNVNINDTSIQFTNDKEEKIVFTADKLVVDGESLDMSSEQRKASADFQKRTRILVPRIAEVAVEGAEIGLKAATLAVTALFGEDDEVHKDLILPIEKISDKIKSNINEKMINANTLENSMEQELEQEVENLVAKAMSKYSGKILTQVLGSIFSQDDEEMKDFEFRMENLEHDIETYVDSQAKDLEKKADKICDDVKILSDLDKQLMAVKGYPEKGLILEGESEGMHISHISFNSNE